MTLVFSIDWSPVAVEVTIVDPAAQTTLAAATERHHPATAAGEVDRWVRSTITAGRAALESLAAVGQTASEIAIVEVHTTVPGGLLALDATGAPVHDALFGTHAESAADADWLLDTIEGGGDAWREATGVLPSSGSTVALLSWLHRTDPTAWRAMARCTLPIGLLAERLGARPALCQRDAVGTAVADRRAPGWCVDLLRVVDDERDWSTTLPDIVPTGTPVGVLGAVIADALGVPTGRPLHIGSVLRA